MNIRVHFLRSLSTQWLRFAVSVLVSIPLLPFVFHRLGDEASGLYVLVFSVTGYYGLLDFGISVSLNRYVARYLARDEMEHLNRFVSTAFFTYCILGVAVLAVSVVGAIYVDSIFRITPQFHRPAQILFFMVGAAMAIGFPMGVFGGILAGMQRFSTLNLFGIGGTLVRAGLVVLVLTHGFGLLAVCFVTLGVRAVPGFIYCAIIFRALPLQVRWRYFDKENFKLMANYSLPAFVVSLGTRFFFEADEAITGMFISAAAVPYFAVGEKLSRYSTGFTDALADLFNPLASHYDATDNLAGLQKMLVQGTRACALTAFPFLALLAVLGKPVITVWMGSRYISAYPVMLVLLVPFVLSRAEDATRRILYGMARHGFIAYVRVAEGSANVVLSILLARHFGIIGVALGTAIPMMATALFFYPVHLCRLLKVSLTRYIYEGFSAALIFCVPLTVVLVILKHAFPTPSYATLAIQAGSGAIVYGGLVLWLFLTHDPLGLQVRNRFSRYMRQADRKIDDRKQKAEGGNQKPESRDHTPREPERQRLL
jgi:O-antigen/teichoic acid export membrane protein